MDGKIDGGPAFPVVPTMEGAGQWGYAYPGMTLRDWFAATIQYDKDIMEDISNCDDQDLIENFGLPEEKDEYFEFVCPGFPQKWKNIELRAKLEARARARIRYREADAMLVERARKE